MTATFTARFTVDRVVSLDPVDCVCVWGGCVGGEVEI